MSQKPAIDYTNKDYASLRRAMLDLARYRLPEWTDHTPSDPGVLLTDMFAYMGDVILYYQDRIASELFPGTAQERRSVLQLLRLIGHELSPPAPARVDLRLVFEVPAGPATANILHGAQFSTTAAGEEPQLFEYLGPTLSLDLHSDQVVPSPDGTQASIVLPASHSRAVPPTLLGSATAEPNQSFRIPHHPLVPESLVVEVEEGSGWVRWDRRTSFLYDIGHDGRSILSSPDAREYTLGFDENAVAEIRFGDGVFGRIPPVGTNNIRVHCRIGGGVIGNVAANAINRAITPLAGLISVTNPNPAAGGTGPEALDHAVRYGPMVYRSGQRAVTLDDYVALARQAGGVAKVRARSRSWNLIELVVAPEGDSYRPVPEGLRTRLLEYFEERRMAGTRVHILDAQGVPVDISIRVRYDPRFQPDAVRQNLIDGLSAHLSYARMDFGQTIYQSDIYALAEAIPGVIAAHITRFQRADRSEESLDEVLQQSNLPALEQLPEFMRKALESQQAVVSRIETGPYELPALGSLEVSMRVGSD